MLERIRQIEKLKDDSKASEDISKLNTRYLKNPT